VLPYDWLKKNGVSYKDVTVRYMDSMGDMVAAFEEEMAKRRQHPTDDLISTLMNARDKNGEPLSDDHVQGSLRLLLIAGIRNAWDMILFLVTLDRGSG